MNTNKYLSNADLDSPISSDVPIISLPTLTEEESASSQPLVNTPITTTSTVPVPLFQTEEDRLAFQNYIETTIHAILISENKRLTEISTLVDDILEKMNSLSKEEEITIRTLRREVKETIPNELFGILNERLDVLLQGYTNRLREEEERFQKSILNADANYKQLLAITQENQKVLLEPFSYPYRTLQKLLYISYGVISIVGLISLFLLLKL